MTISRREAIGLALAAGSTALVLPGGAIGAQAMAEDPIPGVDVVVEKVPPGNAVANVTTDRRGMIALRDLEAGYYEVRTADNTVRAGIRHPGGPVRWQLRQQIAPDRDPTARQPLGERRPPRVIWTLADQADPL